MTLATVSKQVSIPLIAGLPTSRVVIAQVDGLTADTVTTLNSELGFSAAGVLGFIILGASDGVVTSQVYDLTAGVLTVDPETADSSVAICVWGA